MLNGNIFFKLFLSDSDEKIISVGGLRMTQKQKSDKPKIIQNLTK